MFVQLNADDKHLNSLGLMRKHLAKDESCMFRAIAEGKLVFIYDFITSFYAINLFIQS